jgi:peptidoglycan/xylan/chitin deacetylase (PgdA/CDA1 family)
MRSDLTSKLVQACLLSAMVLAGCTDAAANSSQFSSPLTALPTPIVFSVSVTPSPQNSKTPTPSKTPTATTTATSTPTPTWIVQGPGAVEVPILLYHRVLSEEISSGTYSVTVDTFKSHMQILVQNGCQSISVAQLHRAIIEGVRLPQKPVIITFDDGNIDNFDIAFPIMQSYGLTGTAYIVANRLESKGYLSVEQLEQMVRAGWEIGSHSMTHADLTQISAGQLREELLGSRYRLEGALGIEVRSFAYPYGTYRADFAAKVLQYGYYSAVGLGKYNNHDLGNVYYLARREVRGAMTLDEFKSLLGACGGQ